MNRLMSGHYFLSDHIPGLNNKVKQPLNLIYPLTPVLTPVLRCEGTVVHDQRCAVAICSNHTDGV